MSFIDFFVNRQKELLSIEKEEELKRSTKKYVTVVTKEIRSAVVGSFEIELRVLKCPNELKPQLRVGAPILLFIKNTDTIRGVVSRTLAGGSFDCVIKKIDSDIVESEKFFCSISKDNYTMKKYFDTLRKIQKSNHVVFDCNKILNIAFNPSFEPSMNEGSFSVKKWFSDFLNPCQQEAVEFGLSSQDIALIVGPPGTGKTTVVVELIKQLVINENLKVLCSAPSNVAIDHAMNGLLSSSTPEEIRKLRCCRIGHIARIQGGVMNHSLTYLVNKHMSQESLRIRKDIEKSLKKIRKTKRIGEKKKMKREVYQLRKELRKYERKTIHDILSQSHCVLGTLTGCGNDRLVKIKEYDVVIVDECAQSLEIATWMACLKTKGKIILVGDFFQLGPTILSPNKEVEKELSLSLMERMYRKFSQKKKKKKRKKEDQESSLPRHRISRMLETQYRMHEDIMSFSSQQFYENRLRCGGDVEDHLLSDYENVEDIEETSTPLFFIDTANCGFHESSTNTFGGEQQQQQQDDDGSKFNEKEVTECLIPHLERLLSAGVREETIGIITFYNGQVQYIKNLLGEKYHSLEISTVDGFQGREKDVIIISFVRSNVDGGVGFLKNSRRINVAITRAKRHLCIIGDSVTLRKNMFLDSLMKYLFKNADVRMADDEYD